MVRSKRMRWVGLAIVVLVGIAATAVVALSKSADPVSAAISKSEDAGGAKLALTVTVDHGSNPVTITANGVFDENDADITLDAASALAAAGLPGAGGSIEVRYLQENGDPVVYANAPALSSFIPGGQSWVRLDVAQAAQKLGVNLNGLGAAATQNPTDALDLLRSIGSVETVGTETVDGASTTHYRATVDLTKAAANLGTEEQAFVKHLIANGAPTSIPVDVWIGDDGLIHKLTFTQSHESDSVALTLEISGYGTPVTVTAPAPADTFDATNLVGMLGSLPHGSASFPGITH
ncbi:MAG TPA: LppX_LprAFG lipoprotein [Gaiellaceae bacterium]|jgi:hypothetical protein|nr:LppX_LprAFG lipoprotein [Gaiellaceae bacterium]